MHTIPVLVCRYGAEREMLRLSLPADTRLIMHGWCSTTLPT